MNVLIIEDEDAAVGRLTKLVGSIRPDWRIVGVLDSVQDSVKWLLSQPSPDLIFSDIQLADGVAFEIYRKVGPTCPVIFTTAYDNYAIEAFKHNSIDYLLKPVVEDHLILAIQKFEKTKNAVQPENLKQLAENYLAAMERPSERLLIKYGQKLKAISLDDAAYFFIEGRSVMVATSDGHTYPVDETLDELESWLETRSFFRVNRQVIVSFSSISDMVVYSKSRIKLTLKPPADFDVLVSGNRSSDFREWLKGKS